MYRNLLIIAFSLLSLNLNADWLTPEILWQLGRVTDPQQSPDGNTVIYIVRGFDMAANKGNSDIWMVDVKTKATRVIAKDSSNETQPRWSKDGSHIYYLNDAGSTQQLWSMKADGSEKKQISHTDSDINAYGISADESMVWLAQDVKIKKVLGKEIYSDLPKTTGRVYDDLMMRHWDSWEDGAYSHIFIGKFSNATVGELTDIMKDEPFDSPMKPHGGDEEISWSPDGKTLAYTCSKLADRAYATSTNSDIYLYETSGGKTTNVTTEFLSYDKVPVFSPDGTKLMWISWEQPGNEASRQRLFIMDRAGQTKNELTVGQEFNVDLIKWAGRSNRIYFIANVNATDQVFFCDLTSKGNSIRQLTNDTADHNGLSVVTLGSEDRIITSRMSISAPTDIFAIDLKNGLSTQLTFTNKAMLAPLTLGKVEKRMIKSTDGKQILTWVIYPPNFNPQNKYPALLYCQGGPHSTVSQVFHYRWNLQLMAANGYIVVAPNRRGLPGFGKEWNDKITKDWGGQSISDLLSAIDSVAKEPYVNKNRLGAVGASYGGYSTFWLEGHHKKRFKAFIAHCGVYNLESMFATEELFFQNWEMDGAFWRSPVPQSYTKFSPHKFVQNWDTPILIIANEKDYRVPYTQGLEAFSAARMKDIPAKFMSFPDEGHWVLKPQNAIMWQREFFGFLDKYLK
jgi:dipeptidyl aminopeptidase/acylaminoacyl peptidase